MNTSLKQQPQTIPIRLSARARQPLPVPDPERKGGVKRLRLVRALPLLRYPIRCAAQISCPQCIRQCFYSSKNAATFVRRFRCNACLSQRVSSFRRENASLFIWLGHGPGSKIGGRVRAPFLVTLFSSVRPQRLEGGRWLLSTHRLNNSPWLVWAGKGSFFYRKLTRRS